MRISELAQRSNMALPTLKYYLREGLLHPGVTVNATRAEYDESHLKRLHLVRTLIEVGGLSIASVRTVVDTLDNLPDSRHEMLGAAQTAMGIVAPPDDSPEADAAGDLARSLGFDVTECSSAAAHAVAEAVARAKKAGHDVTPSLPVWAAAARTIAEQDIRDDLGTAEPSEALGWAIMANILSDPVILALRRLAQEEVSARKFS